MHAPQDLARRQFQRARGVVHRQLDIGETGLDRLDRNRQKAHQVGEHDRDQTAGQQQPGGDTELLAHPAVERVVEPRERDDHADRDDGAGQRVAGGDDANRRIDRRRAEQALAVGQKQRDDNREQRGRQRQRDRVEREADEARVDHLRMGFDRPQRELRRRYEEAEGQRQEAQREGGRRAPAPQAVLRQVAVAVGRVVILRLAPRRALDDDQRKHEQQQDRGELGRRGGVAETEPGAEDAGGEHVEPEVGHGAVVRQRLHQRQRQAGDDRRTRQRQRDAEKARPDRAAERAADLEHAHRLFEKRGAREQVDVGIQHQRQHRHRAAERLDLGKIVIAVAPAEGLAQRALQRAGEIEQPGIGIGDDVTRKRERQQQRPAEQSLAGKYADARQPGAGDADQQRAAADAEHQQRRVEQVLGQHRVDEVLPDIVGRMQDEARDREDRQAEQRGDQHDSGRPQALQPRAAPRARADAAERRLNARAHCRSRDARQILVCSGSGSRLRVGRSSGIQPAEFECKA